MCPAQGSPKADECGREGGMRAGPGGGKRGEGQRDERNLTLPGESKKKISCCVP